MQEVLYNDIKIFLLGLFIPDNININLSAGVTIVDVNKFIRSHIHKLDLIQDSDKRYKKKHIAYYERLLKVYEYFKNEKTPIYTKT